MIKRPSRPGVALVLVLVCLAVLAIMITSVVRSGLAQNQFLQRRERQLQAYWLSQGGIEHAAARLLASPRNYTGETVELIPDSEVRIVVEADRTAPDTFHITSESTFPKGDM